VSLRVLFGADYFSDSPPYPEHRFVGGAEQTDAAVIAACPWPIERVPTRELVKRRLEAFDILVLGNLQHIAPAEVDALARLGRHVLFEHDYRMCRYRGHDARGLLHRVTRRCVCGQARFGALFRSALGAIFLTRRQLARYRQNPFVQLPPSEVLGCSVMGPEFFEAVRAFQANPPRKSGTVVVHSGSSLKGFPAALAYCKKLGIEPTVLKNASHPELLAALARAERLVFLPSWYEPASRLAVEARFLGCEVVSNERLGVGGEPWWTEPDHVGLEVLRTAAERFWATVERFRSARALE
jgi:hypothetical protein